MNTNHNQCSANLGICNPYTAPRMTTVTLDIPSPLLAVSGTGPGIDTSTPPIGPGGAAAPAIGLPDFEFDFFNEE